MLIAQSLRAKEKGAFFRYRLMEIKRRNHIIENMPAFGVKLDTEVILGMDKTGDDVKILLDIDRLIRSDEIAVLERAA